MIIQKKLSSHNFLKRCLNFLVVVNMVLIGGCGSSPKKIENVPVPTTIEAVDVPGYTTTDREPKFSTLPTPFGEFKPLMVIYTSNTGESYIWFTLSPLGIYSSNQRSKIIANRLEDYRKQKMINIAWGNLGKDRLICAYTREKPEECQIILTLPPDVETKQVLYLLRCKLETPGSHQCAEPIRS